MTARFIAIDAEATSTFLPETDMYCGYLVSEGIVQEFPNRETMVQALEALTINPEGVILVGHNLQYDLAILRWVPNKKVSLFDTMVASWLVDENGSHKLKDLSASILGRPLSDPIKARKNDKAVYWLDYKTTIQDAPWAEVARYCRADTLATYDLAIHYSPLILNDQRLLKTFAAECELIPIATKMNLRGIKIHEKERKELLNEFTEEKDEAESRVFEELGYPINLNSPQQMANVLYSDEWDNPNLPREEVVGHYKNGKEKIKKFPTTVKGLGLEPAKLSSSGQGAVAREALYEHTHLDVVKEYLKFKQYDKLIGTYLEAFPRFSIGPILFPQINLWGTVTGRASGSNPNSQNIPIRGELGNKLRRLFIPRLGRVLLVGDYDQLEYRLVTSFCKDPKLMEVWGSDNPDIHGRAAQELFDSTAPSDEERAIAKTYNYAALYGAGGKRIREILRQQNIDLALKEVKELEGKMEASFPKLFEWKQQVLYYLHETGYVELPSGRRRHLPYIYSGDWAKRSYAERQAINGLPQGTAADIIKRAMVYIHNEIDGDILLQVHDELVVEVDEGKAEESAKRMKFLMEAPSTELSIDVPITVDVKAVKTWGDK